jgi:hypothetical protein
MKKKLEKESIEHRKFIENHISHRNKEMEKTQDDTHENPFSTGLGIIYETMKIPEHELRNYVMYQKDTIKTYELLLKSKDIIIKKQAETIENLKEHIKMIEK